MNVPPTIGMVVSSGKATYAELCTVIGLEGLYDLIEIIMVDAYNDQVMRKKRKADE